MVDIVAWSTYWDGRHTGMIPFHKRWTEKLPAKKMYKTPASYKIVGDIVVGTKDNLRLSYGHVRLPSSPYFVNAHGMSNGAVSTKHRTTMKIMMFQHFRKSKCHPNEVKYI
uniref:Uncharacterized protein n=1 Tax=Romanomermis culicivorax TaxID=13658 RepID=A0A915IJB6_ROMCU